MNIRVGCHFLLQGIFPIQASNLYLLHCWWILYHWASLGRLLWFLSELLVIGPLLQGPSCPELCSFAHMAGFSKARTRNSRKVFPRHQHSPQSPYVSAPSVFLAQMPDTLLLLVPPNISCSFYIPPAIVSINLKILTCFLGSSGRINLY